MKPELDKALILLEHQLLPGFPVVSDGSFAEIMEKLAEVWGIQGDKC